jgi:glycine amidinotransferase/scyllo-inosamine-4-phosphate amidinotransferase 1
VGVCRNYVPSAWSWNHRGEKRGRRSVEEVYDFLNNIFPAWYRDEVAEDLEVFVGQLEESGVRVLRPDDHLVPSWLETPFVQAAGSDFYNMRDLHLMVGTKLIRASSACPARWMEPVLQNRFWNEITEQLPIRLICAPTPQLEADPTTALLREDEDLRALRAYEEEKHIELGGDPNLIWHRLIENEILFDAANVVRLGSVFLYLVSSSGNNFGATWLSRLLGPGVSVETTQAYRASHLDSTILPLNDQTVLVNAARVNVRNLPRALQGWNVLYFEDCAAIPEQEIDFHRSVRLPAAEHLSDLGYETNLSEMSSPWAGLNVLSLDGRTVCVESRQRKLIELLERSGFNVMRVQLRHPYTMLGGLHCSTLDLWRDV